MASHAIVVLDVTNYSQTEMLNRIRTKGGSDKHATLRNLISMMVKLNSSNVHGAARVQVSASASVRASQIVTLSQSALQSATSKVTLFGVDMLAQTTPALSTDWAIGASDAAAAANFAAAVNANTTLAKYVTAAVTAAAAVTITCKMPGAPMNFVPIAKTGNGITLTGTLFAGGVGMDYATVDSFTW